METMEHEAVVRLALTAGDERHVFELERPSASALGNVLKSLSGYWMPGPGLDSWDRMRSYRDSLALAVEIFEASRRDETSTPRELYA
jgi:hypothetical protein